MILHKTHQEEAILSNVGQVGEFRIRNSAKAFNILSSGLYANKIRAIIRELSCNAVDSHKDAGKADTPFDVHLPNQLEPWFSIRDYGTGLDHAHLTNIYTTYFESTKTGSNDFIGALGLGSKSPFSYTDNFTVTAIKDGRKGIYTAFINEAGVPSVALMTEEKTDEPSGVEVKFSVNDRYDYQKFAQEAQEVYRFFSLRPVISGVSGFTFKELKYSDKNIIPGVHYLDENSNDNYHYSRSSLAIMGNIAYPIEIPDSDKTLGNLRKLLECGLVMEFKIGELDFQASREGLSYIPATIEAIRKKLAALNAQLAKHLTTEADKITNLWERGIFLQERAERQLWSAAVEKYVADTKFVLSGKYGMTAQQIRHHYNQRFLKTFAFKETELADKFNIKLRGFHKTDYNDQISKIKPNSEHDDVLKQYVPVWHFEVNLTQKFVFNDTNVGIFQRAKHHYRTEPKQQNTNGHRRHNSYVVYIIEAHDRTKPIKEAEFLQALMSPPAYMSLKGSSLRQQPRRANSTANATILHIEDVSTGHYGRGRWGNGTRPTWRKAGELKDFDSKKTYYYLPMRGFQSLGQVEDVKMLRETLRGSELFDGEIYGVRKADLKAVKGKKNWINLDKEISERLTKLSPEMVLSLVKNGIDSDSILRYDIGNLLDADNQYAKLYATFKSVKKADHRQMHNLERLCQMYKVQMTDDLRKQVAKYKKEVREVKQRYPLLETLAGYTVKGAHVAEYINGVELMHKLKAQDQSEVIHP
jgi:hypothetical protein